MDQATDEIVNGKSQSLKVWAESSYEGRAYKVGKKRAGRLLDGVLHDAMPQGDQR